MQVNHIYCGQYINLVIDVLNYYVRVGHILYSSDDKVLSSQEDNHAFQFIPFCEEIKLKRKNLLAEGGF